MKISIDELFRKDVIDIGTGCRTGSVCDVEFDSDSGQILSLTVCCSDKQFSVRKNDSISVDWNNITVIGKENILVKDTVLPERALKNNKRLFDLFLK